MTIPAENRPATGVFLVANPRMLDPNFMHAVVLLCDHGPQGSYGIVVNRRADKRVSELGSDAPLLAGRNDELWYGGPVSGETLQILHRLPPPVPGSFTVAPGIQLGGSQDALLGALSDCQGGNSVRFVLGYSGWSADQLDHELREGAWIVCPARGPLIFDGAADTLWRRVLRARGGPYAQLAELPPDPTWN